MAALVVLGAAVGAWPVHAGEPDPLSDAREHYERGMARYQLGEFSQAVDEFKIAYEASRAPGLLFNLAQASRLAKQYEEAIHFYRAYLRARPDAPNRVDAENRILELEPLVEEQKQHEKEIASEVAPPSENQSTMPPPAPPLQPQPPAIVAPPLETHLRLRDGRRERIAGLVTGAAGVALIGVGIYFGATALADQSDVSKVATTMGAWTPSAQSTFDSGRSDATAATVLYAVGGAAVAAGIGTYLWGWRRDVRARRFAVAPAPGGAQASFACDF